MESQVHVNIKMAKENTIARFNLLMKIATTFQFLLVLAVFALVLLSVAHTPAAVRVSGKCLLKLSAYLFNYHVIFLAGNAIIVLLFILRSQNDVSINTSDLIDNYVTHTKVHHPLTPVFNSTAESEFRPPEKLAVDEEGGCDDEMLVDEKGIMCADYDSNSVAAKCDELTTAIERAAVQIKRFQRILSAQKLWRSETENQIAKAEIEKLSNEEFQCRVQAFISKHRKFFFEQKLGESNLN